jgi:hypothetical protein
LTSIKTKKERPAKPVKAKIEKPAVQRPEKDNLYKTRKKGGMIFLRILLWGFIVFIFYRGVIVSLRPDTAGEALRVISDFRAEFSGYKELDSELLAFAEVFAAEYLTFKAGEESNYKERLMHYTTRAVSDALTTRFISGTESEPSYVRAYRKEPYSPTQYDIYVVAEVLYSRREAISTDEGTEYVTAIETERVILKVPVAFSENRYIVEDFPAFVVDDVKMHDYIPVSFSGRELDRDKQSEVLEFLTDFFGAYYGERQSVIDNYLAPDADKSRFRGLNGLLDFTRLESSSKVYYPSDMDRSRLIAPVTLTARDKTGNTVTQNFTVTLIERDGRYFVRRLDTRIRNINIIGG